MTTISNIMATSIKIEGTATAAESLKSLTNAVKSATSSWKIQEAQLKSSGDRLGAIQAKYDGLGTAMGKLQDKIDLLKTRMSSLDQSTEQGKTEFTKYQTQLASAERQMSSLSSQQDRTAKSLDYYKTGLGGLQSSYRAITSANQAYVERLEAEGKTQEANRAKVKSYQDSIENLSKQLKIQEDDLSKVSSEGDKSSEAYLKQKQRVDETATALAKAKNEMNDFDDSMKKANPSFFDKLKSQLTKTNSEAKETDKSLGDIIKGSAIGSAIGNGISTLASDLGSAAKNGFQLDVAGDELKKRWSDLGLPTKAVNGLMNQIGQIRGVSNESGAAINQLQVKLYNLTGGSISRTEALTNELFAFGKQAGLSGDQIDGMGAKLTRLFSTQKVNLSTFNRTFADMPGLKEAIVKASGMTSDAFTKALSAGKITGQQLQALMVKAASQSSKAWADFGTTSAGKLAKVQGTFTNLEATFMKPIETTALKGINSVLDSMVGKNGRLTSTGSAVNAIAKNLSKSVSHAITDAISFIVKNKGSLSTIASSLGTILKTIGSTIWDDFKGIISGIAGQSKGASKGLGGFASAMKKIAGHKDTIATITNIGVAVLGIVSAMKILIGVLKIVDILANANPIGLAIDAIVLALAALVVGFVEAYKKIKPFRDFINGLGKDIASFAKSVGKFFGSAWNAAVIDFKGMTKTISGWGKDISKWVSNFSKSFGKVWNSAWKGVGKTLSSDWKGMKKTISGWGTNISKWNKSFSKTFSKAWSSTWKTAGKNLSSSWKTMKKTISSWGTNIGKWTKSFAKTFSKNWSSHWKTTKKTLSTAWSDMKTNTSKWGTNIGKWHDSFQKSFHKSWESGWKNTKSFLSTSWTDMHKLSTSWGSKMSSWLTTFNKDFSKGWKSMWGGIKSFMSDTWTNIKNGAKSGFNGVISIINDVIGAINNVWKFFTGKKALGKLQKLAKGGVITATQRLVMVNDDGTANPKELIQLPTGQMGFFNGRNVKAILPEGTRVYNSKETNQIFKMAGIEHYAGGGIVGSVEKAVSGTADKLKEIGDWLAHPVKSVESMISNSINGASAGIKNFTTLAKGVVSKLTDSIVKWFKEKLQKLNDEMSVPNPSGSGVMRWKPDVIKALKANGFSATDLQVKSWLAVIQRESGGNPRAINLWDSNAKAGIPSMGLVQTIEPTFNAYKFPGHGNVYNGYDDLLAGIHYMKAIYGSGSGAFERVADPNIGYANGGIVGQQQLALIAEGNKNETIIPWDLSKRSKAYQLMDETMQAFKQDDNASASSSPSDSTESTSVLTDLLSKVVTLLQNDNQKQVVINLDGQSVANVLAPYTAKAQTTYSSHQTRLTKGVRQSGSITG